MGWSKGDGILNAVVENSMTIDRKSRKALFEAVVDELADLDYDEIGDAHGAAGWWGDARVQTS